MNKGGGLDTTDKDACARRIQQFWWRWRDKQMFLLLKHSVRAAEMSLSYDILRKVSSWTLTRHKYSVNNRSILKLVHLNEDRKLHLTAQIETNNLKKAEKNNLKWMVCTPHPQQNNSSSLLKITALNHVVENQNLLNLWNIGETDNLLGFSGRSRATSRPFNKSQDSIPLRRNWIPANCCLQDISIEQKQHAKWEELYQTRKRSLQRLSEANGPEKLCQPNA